MISRSKIIKVMDKLKQPWRSNTKAEAIRHKVHSIKLGDVDDPELYIAQPIWEWQQTDAGKYVMANSVPEPSWHRHMDMNTYGYEYFIMAYFTPKQLTYWKLKYE